VKLTDDLNAFWISKLGTKRVTELSASSRSGTTLDKARNVLTEMGKDRALFHKLMFEGFDGFFHQSVFSRFLGRKSMAKALEDLAIGNKGPVTWMARESLSAGRVRVLGGVQKQIEFLTETDDVIRQDVTIPAMAEALPSYFRVRVLTLQSTVKLWTELLARPIRRILTPVIDTELSDLLFQALSKGATDLGVMHDLSRQAVELMKNTGKVHTYSGTFGVRKVGRTRHTTEGGGFGRRRQPLHIVMRPEFDELIASDQIRHCEIEIQEDYEGLISGTALVLYPMEGKIVFRRMLGGGLIDDFLAYLAR
jgi:hypothetical protein